MMKVTRAPKGFEAEFNQMKMEEEMAKNPQMGMGAMGGMGGMGFPYPMAGGRLGPLGGGMGMGGGMGGPMGGAMGGPMGGGMGGRPGIRPGMGGRMGPGRPGAAGTRRGMGAGIGPGKRPGAGPRRMPGLTQGPVQQWSGSGPPHLSASYQKNMQKDIGASQYSEAAIKAINNYKKRIGTNLPEEAKRPMSPPGGMGGGMMGQGMMGQAGMNPMMNMMANMMGMQPPAPVTTPPPTQSMEIVNGIPMLVSNPAPVQQAAPMQPAPMPDPSYPAAIQPLPDDAFSSNAIKRQKGIPVKTNVPKSYLEKISAQPDFARIPPGAGAAQNKKPKIQHSINEGIMPWNDKSQGNEQGSFWSMEKIIGIVAGVIILISAAVIGVMCCLRARTKEQNREYKEREKINAGKCCQYGTICLT